MNPPQIPSTLPITSSNTSDTLVLITGAGGHLGFRILVSTLEAGHCVMAIARDEEQLEKIARKPSVQPYRDRLTFALVKDKDLDAPRVFEHFMQEVTHVIHNASLTVPPGPRAKKGDKALTIAHRFYDPARKGVMTVLDSASRARSVRRVVITSNVIILEPSKSEFGSDPYDVKKSLPAETANAADEFEAFSNSKVIAYEAALNFAKERKPRFDIVHVLAGFMQGASELYETVKDMQNEYNKQTINTALGNIDKGPKMMAQVLLQDVAKLHVIALDLKAVRSMENLVAVANDGRGISWDEIADIVKRCYPKEVEAGILRPTKGQQDYMVHVDVRSTEKASGAKFSEATSIVRSVIDQYLQLRGK